MTKTADIGSKRLISLAPDVWARWLTGDPAVEALDFLSGEFQWVARATDVLLKARSPRHGTFLIANEIQFRPDARMPQRIRAYAALAEERYGLNVYPVVVNILRPKSEAIIVDHYHSELMGLIAHQDYKVLNLWEIEASEVINQPWTTLLPFVPVLRGGDSEATINKALALLRADATIAEMEPLLAFFATFVMTPDEVRNVMRWNATMLRESPWYNELMKEGLELGLEQGREQGLQQGLQQGRQEGEAEILLFILTDRFGEIPADLAFRIRTLSSKNLRALATTVVTVATLDEVVKAVHGLTLGAGNNGFTNGQTNP